MKALIVACTITLAIILGWYFIYNSVEDSASQLMGSLSELKKSIDTGQWEIAKLELEQIEKRWSKVRPTWTVILDHHEIDNIDLAMAKASEYVKSQSTDLSLGEIETLRKLFSIVKENEALTLTNIL